MELNKLYYSKYFIFLFTFISESNFGGSLLRHITSSSLKHSWKISALLFYPIWFFTYEK